MQVEIWSLGRESDAYIDEGVKLYLQKLRPYCWVELITIKPPKKLATTEPEKVKQQEEALILKRLQPHHYLILLDERGRQLSSPQWASAMQELMNRGTKTLILLIGGAFGVSDQVRERARQVWSLSTLVFPHQLVRLIVAEQLYRSFSILNNSPYHHA